jgi:hypothetical protein
MDLDDDEDTNVSGFSPRRSFPMGTSAVAVTSAASFFSEPRFPNSTVTFDERGRAHRGDGPAVLHFDGKGDYYWHGVQVPQHVVMAPEKITVEEIDFEENAEVRRVMLERFGVERFLKQCKAKLVHTDETGKLFRWRAREGGRGEEALQFVVVKNSTPEPDGTYKDYYLRVPPGVTTARAAVAWTFGMDARQYKPQKET